HSLLVAEDHGPPLSRGHQQARRPHHLPRLQPHLLPAVHPRLPRDAAPLPRLSRGVPSPERHLDGGRLDPRRRLPDAHDLPHLVALVRGDRPAEPLARDRARVADTVPPTPGQPRDDPDRHDRALRLLAAARRARLSTRRRSPISPTTATTSARP